MKSYASKLAVVLAATFAAGGSCLADDRVDFGFDASAGVKYDTDVGIADLDENSGEADSRTGLAAGVDAKFPAGERLSLRLGYDYSGSSYRRFSEFDIDLYHAQAEAAFDFGRGNAALTVDRYRALLDGDRYLTVRQWSPNLSRLFGSRLFLRGAYLATCKEYADATERGADADALRLDAYLLFAGMSHYLSFDFTSSDEDAVDDQLDFEGRRVGLGYGHRLELPQMEVTIKARWLAERRDYRNVTEAIEEPRRDTRRTAGLTAAIPFSDHIGIEGEIERRHHVSNLDAANLDEVVYGVKLTAKF